MFLWIWDVIFHNPLGNLSFYAFLMLLPIWGCIFFVCVHLHKIGPELPPSQASLPSSVSKHFKMLS